MMVNVVIDTSVVASWFLPHEEPGQYANVLDRIDKIKIHVPSIFEHELMNILLNAYKKKRLDFAMVIEILEIIGHYPITIESSTAMLIERINVFKLAQAHDLTIYDAAYLELSVRLHAPLLTYDKSLSNAARKLQLRTNV